MVVTGQMCPLMSQHRRKLLMVKGFNCRGGQDDFGSASGKAIRGGRRVLND